MKYKHLSLTVPKEIYFDFLTACGKSKKELCISHFLRDRMKEFIEESQKRRVEK